jgi:hypothetical protein
MTFTRAAFVLFVPHFLGGVVELLVLVLFMPLVALLELGERPPARSVAGLVVFCLAGTERLVAAFLALVGMMNVVVRVLRMLLGVLELLLCRSQPRTGGPHLLGAGA